MKQIKLSYTLLSFFLLTPSLPIMGDDITETRAKNPDIIASHVIGIVGNVVNLVKDPKDEDVIGTNIVGLFGNILACIFAATKRSNIEFDMNQEDINTLLASLDQDVIEAIQKAVMTRAQQIRSIDL